MHLKNKQQEKKKKPKQDMCVGKGLVEGWVIRVGCRLDREGLQSLGCTLYMYEIVKEQMY